MVNTPPSSQRRLSNEAVSKGVVRHNPDVLSDHDNESVAEMDNAAGIWSETCSLFTSTMDPGPTTGKTSGGAPSPTGILTAGCKSTNQGEISDTPRLCGDVVVHGSSPVMDRCRSPMKSADGAIEQACEAIPMKILSSSEANARSSVMKFHSIIVSPQTEDTFSTPSSISQHRVAAGTEMDKHEGNSMAHPSECGPTMMNTDNENSGITNRLEALDIQCSGSPPAIPRLSLLLLNLPSDSLHGIASFLSPRDWIAMSCSSRHAHRVCSPVFHRIRMHGFKCATEVVTAWLSGEHADAKELVGLYLSSGVPIYPRCHGLEYKTLTWRMRAESSSMMEAASSDNSTSSVDNSEDLGSRNSPASTPSTLDRFYVERNSSRERRSLHHSNPSVAANLPPQPFPHQQMNANFLFNQRLLQQQNNAPLLPVQFPNPLASASFLGNASFDHRMTYLEEKCEFWRQVKGEESPFASAGGGSPLRSLQSRSVAWQHAQGTGLNGRANNNTGRQLPPPLLHRSLSLNASDISTHQRRSLSSTSVHASNTFTSSGTSKKMKIKCHGHLVHQHELQKYSVLDIAGASNDVADSSNFNIPHHMGNDLLHHGGAGDGSNHPAGEDIMVQAGEVSLSIDFFHPHTKIDGENDDFDPLGGIAKEDLAGYTASFCSRQSRLSSFCEVEGSRIPDPLHEGERRGVIREEQHRPGDPQSRPQTRSDGAASATIAHIDSSVESAFPSMPRMAGGDGNNNSGAGGSNSEAEEEESSGQIRSSRSPEREFERTRNLNRLAAQQRRLRPDLLRSGVSLRRSLSLGNLGLIASGNRYCPMSSRSVNNTRYNYLHNVAVESYTSTQAPSSLVRRFDYYRTRLTNLLNETHSRHDSTVFDNALSDFWDEFFPLTKYISHHDGYTAVPRYKDPVSLEKFLTEPCPKSLGIIQCEIERVRVNRGNGKSKKKNGRGVKGRLFPQYEYRLFIRDRTSDDQGGENNGREENSAGDDGEASTSSQPRNVVLMTAKNLGRNFSSLSASADNHSFGVGDENNLTRPSTPVLQKKSKRGVNNYFLYMASNKGDNTWTASADASDRFLQGRRGGGIGAEDHMQEAVELGRLQSNLLGTEFQIFAPVASPQKDKRRPQQFECARSSPTPQIAGVPSSASTCTTSLEISPASTAVSSNMVLDRSSISASVGERLSMEENEAHNDVSNSAKSDKEISHRATGQQALRGASSKSRRSKLSRKSSWPGLIISRSKLRTNRRAIAQDTSIDASDACLGTQEAPFDNEIDSLYRRRERENGAITYTANLLGNRPRIMDVCIPKLMGTCDNSSLTTGNSGMHRGGRMSFEAGLSDWEKCRERLIRQGDFDPTADGGNLMLTKFKQVLQDRVNSNSESQLTNQVNDDNNAGAGVMDNNDGNNHVEEEADPVEADIGEPQLENEEQGDEKDFGLQTLQNRPPWWNTELGAFVLNFGGRVSVASVKNFQLCDRNDQEYIMLQFGRIQGRHAFTMDFQYPLSAVQAFSIAISSLQSKISLG